MREKIQLFIHRHYDGIKLALLVITFGIVFITLLLIIDSNNRESKERQEAFAQQQARDSILINAISDENDEQTEIMNRQFRAICLLIIETSGQEGLNKLDAESRKRCENLHATEEELASPRQSVPDNRFQNNTSVSPSFDTPSNDSTADEETPQPEIPQEDPDDSIIPLVEEPIVGCSNIIVKVCL